jgi:putative salt-induced outer membrane protein
MTVRTLLALATLAVATPARADQPPPPFPHPVAIEPLPPTVQAMIEDAFANGTDAEIEAVVKFARRAYPTQVGILDTRLAERTAARQAEEQARQAAERERLLAAGPFENWTGRGEIGASRSSGNVDNLGIYASLNLAREGVSWRHAVRASAEVQETNGVRTQERLLFAYEPRYKVSDRLSAYGLLQAERDPLLGYDARYSGSLGLGYALVKARRLTVDVQGGPALRYAQLTDDGAQLDISGRAALDARLQLRPGVTLTQNATAFLDSQSNTFTSATGLETQLIGALTARVSYNVQHESDPAVGRVATDTQSRVTFVYAF